MAHGHAQHELTDDDKKPLGDLAWPIYRTGFAVGAVSLLLALLVAVFVSSGGQRLAYAYLVAVLFALALSIGSMFFVLLTHLFRAGWCVLVRRVFEIQAANVGVVAVLLVPILAVVAAESGVLYGWNHPADALAEAAHHGDHDASGEAHGEAPRAAGDADFAIVPVADTGQGRDAEPGTPAAPAHAEGDAVHGDDEAPHAFHASTTSGSLTAGATAYYALQKRPFLNRAFFIVRVVAFALIWAWIATAFWKRSLRQDDDRDHHHSRWREKWAAPLTLVAALTVTFGSFDLLMSLDPGFYSTIFGVYYFAGAFLLALCWGVLTLKWLQGRGYLPSVNVEHYHDLGKLMFAFVFFWGYIAFSQYMLIWYANIPEVTYWLEFHGMSTDDSSPMAGSWWKAVAMTLLFGHLLIPFLGLLSRTEKRRGWTLCFWAGWLIVMCYIDLYWVARPVLSFYGVAWGPADLLLALLCLVGVMGIYLGGLARRAANHALVPLHDPRVHESLALRQI